jgi:CheY-like chemotaxis protein
VGQGTGLGLAVVHGIVQNHDGAILVQSEVGKGTEFQVYIPAQADTVHEDNPALLPPPPAQGEHVLVVDDEVAIVRVLKHLLSRAGYKVTAYTSPIEALKEFLSQPEDVFLVLTDLTMPEMNGVELAAKIYEIRPNLPVIITTGYGGDILNDTKQPTSPNIRQVVEKPVNPDDILRFVAELLPDSQL